MELSSGKVVVIAWLHHSLNQGLKLKLLYGPNEGL